MELDPEVRLQVLLMHRGITERDHYRLLGVGKDVDRKELKRAYFNLASRFHPDKYFRKRLGSFKPRMELIFTRLTIAHDTLSNHEQRLEYDGYLDEQRRSRGIEELLEDALAEIKRAEELAEREAREAEKASSSGPPAALNPSSPPRSPSAPSVPTVNVAVAARRDALARRLLGGRATSSSSMPAARVSSSTPPRAAPADAMDALRRRYEERKQAAKVLQARAYVTKGREALDKGDPVTAANSLRVAQGLVPEDDEIARLAEEAQTKANEVLATTYARQAQYEERNQRWAEAARSWTRVSAARPRDARALDRAAKALVKASGDLREAAGLAKRACELEPNVAALRATLAAVYIAAGLTHSARRELETAAQLAPQDDTIQAMLKSVGRSA